MNYRQYNDFCKALPATTYVQQWGGAHVWKVGGKVFAIGGWEDRAYPGITFKVTPLSYDMLKTQPGLRPAPYLARAHWISVATPYALGDEELRELLTRSHQLVVGKLPKKLQVALKL